MRSANFHPNLRYVRIIHHFVALPVAGAAPVLDRGSAGDRRSARGRLFEPVSQAAVQGPKTDCLRHMLLVDAVRVHEIGDSARDPQHAVARAG